MDELVSVQMEELERIIRQFKVHIKDIVLLLVVNVKRESKLTANCFDYETEFFSKEELNDFIEVITQLELYYDISYDENEFFRKLNSGYFSKFNDRKVIVYNTTGSKRIRSRSALVPAICELHNIIYASNDILTANILENKIQVFSILSYYGYKVPKFWIYHNRYGWVNSIRPDTNVLLIAKPANECASIGITEKSVSMFNDEFQKHIFEVSTILNQPIIVQEFISGWEVEVPVFDIEKPIALSVVGIQIDNEQFLKNKFLPYESIYTDNYSFYNYDTINPTLAERIKIIACSSYKILDLYGTVRVDFRISENNIPYITDYNNSPHLTRFHSCAEAAKYFGLKYADMFCIILYKAMINSLQMH